MIRFIVDAQLPLALARWLVEQVYLAEFCRMGPLRLAHPTHLFGWLGRNDR